MSTPPLSGRAALVTGGGVGIGAAIARALAEAGASVVVTYRTHVPDDDVLAALGRGGGKPLAVQVDATSEPEVRRAVDAAVDHLGRLDVLVNNVGGLVGRATLAELDLERWRTVLAVNLDSMFLFTHHAVNHLPRHESGRVINVASLAGHTGGHPGALAYATAKAGVLGFTRALATELGPQGITANALAPGFIEATPFHDTFTTPESKARTVAGIPLGRPGRPDDVAGAVRWLASDDAAFVSGAVIDINGAQHFH
ncbi:3-oxoacyl-[acyl-carrier protein] reductase [Promicromonospora umidemergens]|uniref:SDR family oxidoreductase n=1 Tax=Promicromonospora umidemergens TaxID=629679 RepID=A0ABP8XZV0_9MICO|nr:SDR family NAD(P)-dependent oxidoreductase [Promicromonospora umidemergens]MCP2284186.1 3-oxoacyl-[acyl-carrier protein] reductase [Promicromonospora umidemergens]